MAHADNENLGHENSTAAATRDVLWLTAGAIALLIVIAVVALFVVSREMNEARGSHVEVQRTREVLEQLQLVLSTLQDAETGERGYVITGNEEFLAPYYAAERSLPGQLQQLLASGVDPDTQALRQDLAQRAREQIEFLKRVVELRAAGDADSAAGLIKQQTGRQRMDSIRALV